jgi:hypothetical protein
MQASKAATCVAAALLTTACAGDGTGLDQNGRPGDSGAMPLVPEFESIQSNVFTPICATCHSGAAAPLGLRLDADASYAMLVNAPSVEAPSLKRVTPGNPDASYLIHKVEGTAAAGGRMPLGGPALPAETIAVIRQWIANGAQPAAVSPAAITAQRVTTLDAVWPEPDAELREAPREIVLISDAELDTTLLDAGVVSLRRSGGDGNFDNGNELVMTAELSVRSLEPSVIAITAPAEQWVADRYELRVSGGPPVALADRSARPIDGDGDGVPGGDFVLQFELETDK